MFVFERCKSEMEKKKKNNNPSAGSQEKKMNKSEENNHKEADFPQSKVKNGCWFPQQNQ